ncbi:ABC1-domain-containing protein [Rhizopus microsporus var. microsporus]|uniref:ABC1-domain-containing protein n=2 Tax=Rhizopus microsporus TaxID=58291 RepID=A0A2G4SNV7_RHIZD|nr:ABC1-domain-containing protein [Rhizopus microsporus ATCC 52813]ORE04948.1 ABC1-domain-containing protein [Rhizopus microsporus var. microsporus]PHZ10459.1 ABC1-domain-containing protein [Rhizopus microsporus ATCC 52813]
MLRVPLQRNLSRITTHCNKVQHRLIFRKTTCQSVLSKATLAHKPALYVIPTTALSAATPFYLHSKHDKAIRIGSIDHPATPQEIEIAEANYESEYLIVRLCLRVVKLLDDWIIEPVLTLRRLAHILILFIPIVLTAPSVYFGKYNPIEGERSGTLWWFDFLAKQMERAGPTFIKLAQWIASRTDLFPLALCIRLSKLHSNVDPHPFSYTKRVIEESFGRPLDEIFSELDREPLGVGAIAQVYKAKLRPQIILEHEIERAALQNNVITADTVQTSDEKGRPINLHTSVAIKILHPKARQIVQRDLIIMDCCARLLTLIPTIHWLSLPDEVRVFGEMMKEQLDLRGEGRNLARFNHYFKDTRNVKFPRPLLAFTTKDMLLEEYEHGVPLDIFLAQAIYTRKNNENNSFNEKLAHIGLDAFLHMLIVYNFVHADLHPGNIMVKFYKPEVYHPLRAAWAKLLGRELKDEGEKAVERVLSVKNDPAAMQNELEALKQEGYAPKLVFIDTGLVTELNTVNRRNFLDLFQAVATFDGYKTGELMVERSRSPEQVVQPDVFALRMQNLILGLKQSTFNLGAVKIGNLLHETMNMVRAHHVKLEGDFVNVVVSIMLLEGIGRQLNPDLDLFKNALPVLRDYSMKEGGKAALEEIKKDPTLKKGHWIKVWIFLELRTYLMRNTREEEWMQLCDILAPNI